MCGKDNFAVVLPSYFLFSILNILFPIHNHILCFLWIG